MAIARLRKVVKKIPKHIEIVRSTILELSSLSQESCDAIYGVLSRHYAFVGVSIVNTIADLGLLIAKRPDVVFMGMKSLPGNHYANLPTVWVADFLENHGIAHTGSGQPAIEFELNKPLAKQRILDAAIPTAAFLLIKNGDTFPVSYSALRFPLFVKPANLGGGQGISEHSLVHNLEELELQISSVMASCDTDVLVEEYLPGREFSVAILEDEHSTELLC